VAINAFDFVAMHDANSASCTHFGLRFVAVCVYYSTSVNKGQPFCFFLAVASSSGVMKRGG